VFESCQAVYESGVRADGFYKISLLSGVKSLYCKLNFAGGGWTYVSRGSPGTGPQTGRKTGYGSIPTGPDTGDRWSLSDADIDSLAANADGTTTSFLEYFVTQGDGDHCDSPGMKSLQDFRVFRAPMNMGFTHRDPMDANEQVEVWNGNKWAAVDYKCNKNDNGPCWEPGAHNICCSNPGASFFDAKMCRPATANFEGQFSHNNNNQHLRCHSMDYEHNKSHNGNCLVVYVRPGQR
jgi:hypothetical protein